MSDPISKMIEGTIVVGAVVLGITPWVAYHYGGMPFEAVVLMAIGWIMAWLVIVPVLVNDR